MVLGIEPRASHLLPLTSIPSYFFFSIDFFEFFLSFVVCFDLLRQGLALLFRLALNQLCSPDRPQTLGSLLSAGIMYVHHHAQLLCVSWILILCQKCALHISSSSL